MSKHWHINAAVAVLSVMMAIGCRAVGAGPDAEPVTTQNLVELIATNKMATTARGAGMDRVSLELHRLDAGIETVHIPAGTFFVAHRAAVQNMVVTSPQTIKVSGEGWVSVDVTAAAANLERVRPISGDTFEVRAAPEHDDLRRLIAVLAPLATTYAVRQAAVWVVTDDASYDELGTVVWGYALNTARVIDDVALADALEICDRAGIDVTRKAVWHDLDRIIRGMPLGKGDWLRRKGSAMTPSPRTSS